MPRKTIEQRLQDAVKQFWKTRDRQSRNQGQGTGDRDRGSRSAVTGGAQMHGFIDLFRDLIQEQGIPADAIFDRQKLELPGYFRAEKKWDLVVILDSQLIAAVEVKSQVGSFGNNFNNRAEEAIGIATDLHAAYREGKFVPSPQPWIGFLMLLEDTPRALAPVGCQEPHFEVFPEFKSASYADRYQILMTKLVRERIYNSGCLILSANPVNNRVKLRQPNPELDFQKFTGSLIGHIQGALLSRKKT